MNIPENVATYKVCELHKMHNCENCCPHGLLVGNCPVCVNRIYNKRKPINNDPINHPAYYNSHPSKVECIDIIEHMNFCIGNAIKYLWRAGLKGSVLEDLKKAKWYIEREIQKLEKQRGDI